MVQQGQSLLYETMFHVKQQRLQAAKDLSKSLKISPSSLARRGISINQDGVLRSALDLLAYPDFDWARITSLWPELGSVAADTAEQLSIDARYEGYLARQRQDIAAYRRDEALELPADLDYAAVGSLSNEVQQKLSTHRPATLGQAARISGVTATEGASSSSFWFRRCTEHSRSPKVTTH